MDSATHRACQSRFAGFLFYVLTSPGVLRMHIMWGIAGFMYHTSTRRACRTRSKYGYITMQEGYQSSVDNHNRIIRIRTSSAFWVAPHPTPPHWQALTDASALLTVKAERGRRTTRCLTDGWGLLSSCHEKRPREPASEDEGKLEGPARKRYDPRRCVTEMLLYGIYFSSGILV